MNDLQDTDFPILEHNPVHIVHCPASHRYFGHQPFPMDRLRAIGINIALGTDSLRQRRLLSLFEEMRNVCNLYPPSLPG